MVNNFDTVRKLLNFESKDDFYFVTLFRRKKDDHADWTTDCNNVPVRNYYIKSLEDYDRKKEDIIRVATATNARVYFWINKRSFKKCSFKLISAVATNIETENYEGNKGAWDSVCGAYPNDKNKKWIIDYDVSPDTTVFLDFYDIINDILKQVQPIELHNVECPGGDIMTAKSKIITTIPTVNGKHIITKPFDVKTFHKLWEEKTGTKIKADDIKKDSPTLLYYGGKNNVG